MRNFFRKIGCWCKQVLVASDQFLNSLLGGWADETLSSRCWRNRDKKAWRQARIVVDFVASLLGDKEHCKASFDSERLRLQCPPELREG